MNKQFLLNHTKFDEEHVEMTKSQTVAILCNVTVFITRVCSSLDVLLVNQRFYALLNHRYAGREADFWLRKDLKWEDDALKESKTKLTDGDSYFLN